MKSRARGGTSSKAWRRKQLEREQECFVCGGMIAPGTMAEVHRVDDAPGPVSWVVRHRTWAFPGGVTESECGGDGLPQNDRRESVVERRRDDVEERRRAAQERFEIAEVLRRSRGAR